MNGIIKYGFWFLAGVVAAKTGSRLMSAPDHALRATVVGTLAQGIAAKDKVFASMEKAKENIEDVVAEAKHMHAAERKNANQPGSQPESQTGTDTPENG